MIRKNVLLLGAGASTLFEYKLATEVVNDFTASEQLSAQDLRIIKELSKSIRRNLFVFDSEALMECLQGRARPYPYVKVAGPFISSIARTQPITRMRRRSAYRRFMENLRYRFEEYLIKQYYKEDIILKMRVEQAYNRLLSKVSGVTNWRRSRPPFNNSVFELFTTNYDNSLDVYALITGEPFTRGIRILADNTINFVPDEFDQPEYRLKIYKLHGSVELSRLVSGFIVSDIPPSLPGHYVNGSRVAAKVMVYGLSKDMYSEPYLDLLQRLSQVLKKVRVCTVVGYSFRDPWIRQIFEDTAFKKKPSEFKVKLVSRSADEIVKSWNRLRPYIIPIPETIQQFLDIGVG